MSRWLSYRRILPSALAAVLAMMGPTNAWASTYSAGAPITVSGPSPFASCPFGPPGTVYVNAEVEARVAVDPSTPNHLVGVWQQDRWNNGGAHGLMAATSTSGGASWTSSFAAFDRCEGNTDYDRASDPWVSIAPNGDAHQISLSLSADQTTSAVLVSKMASGTTTWSSPITLIRDSGDGRLNDKESITADSHDSRFVYAVWDRVELPGTQFLPPEAKSHAFRGVPMFSRSTDGGQTWEPARSMLQGNPNDFTIGNQIVMLPDGTLVDVTFLGTGSGVQPSNHNFIAVLRSTDRGVSWSRPIVVATFEGAGVSNPDTGSPVRAGDNLPEAAVDASSGSVYITWGDGRFSNFTHDDIALSRSNDGGLSWSDPTKVNQTPVPVSAFLATPAVASDGTVGVSYYDFRNNTPDRSRLPTDVWLVHCHARTSNCTSPGSWSSETHLSGSFDLDTAPVARGLFVGDYEGLVATGTSFLAFFVATNSSNRSNRTDVFAVRVSP